MAGSSPAMTIEYGLRLCRTTRHDYSKFGILEDVVALAIHDEGRDVSNSTCRSRAQSVCFTRVLKCARTHFRTRLE